MEFRDLKRQYQALKPQMDEALLSTAAEARFIQGPAVAELEEKLAAYTGRKHCISCGDGTDALVIPLRAWGIGPGDAVFVPDMTFFASAECVAMVGATPIFVDVVEETFNMDAAKLDAAIEKVRAAGKLNPKVVIAVDLFGQPADYNAIVPVVEKHGLLLLEDGAQGFGGRVGQKPVGAFGHVATTSFFPAKPLGCYGDGGAIFTDDDALAELMRSLTKHGKGKHKYDNVRIGYNSRLDTMQAAVLLVKLSVFDDEVKAVNEVAKKYTALLKDTVATPVVPEGFSSSWAQYNTQLPSEAVREKLEKALAEAGIPTMIYYPKTMSEQEAFAGVLDVQVDACPIAKKLARQSLALPMHPYLTDEEIATIANAVKAALA